MGDVFRLADESYSNYSLGQGLANSGGYGGLLASGGLSAFGGILGGLASYFGGGKQRKRTDQLYNQGQGMIGQKPFDGNRVGEEAYRMALPQLRAFGQRAEKQFGLDSGVGVGAFGDQALQAKMGLTANANKEAAMAQFQRDPQLLQYLANLNRG